MDYKEIFKAIDVLHTQAAEAKKNEPDDFNYDVLQQLDHCAQRALWHLTRGEKGEFNNLQFRVEFTGTQPCSSIII